MAWRTKVYGKVQGLFIFFVFFPGFLFIVFFYLVAQIL
jgi:hypothetical protein